VTGTVTQVLVVIPTYDEASTIAAVVRAVRAALPTADVLVVDDSSPDGTGELADQLASNDRAVHVLHRAGKHGLGAAYRAGFGWGLERGYEVLAQLDADGSHPPEYLPELVSELTREQGPSVGLVLGSRWVPGGSVVDWPRHRELLSRGGSTYARRALGTEVRDVTSGYRAYRRGTLEEIRLDDVRSRGYCFQIDMLRRVLAAGYGVVEVPIRFVERSQGESKMSVPIVAEALWQVTRWGAERRLRGVRTQLGRS